MLFNSVYPKYYVIHCSKLNMFQWEDTVRRKANLKKQYDSYIFITLETDSETRTPHIYIDVPSHNDPSDDRLIALCKGGKEKQTNRILESYGTSDGVISEMLVSDTNLWVGTYIQYMELHNLTEESVHRGLRECIPEEYTEYTKWNNNLSDSDRKIRLLNQAESDNEWDPLYEDILDIGTWRKHNNSTDIKNFSEEIHKDMEFETDECYKNARRVIQKNKYWKNKNVKYCEGIFLPKNAARIVGHGWIEYKNSVVELTLPWHIPVTPKEAIYFGAEVSRKKLKSAWDNNEGGPYILNIKDSKIA